MDPVYRASKKTGEHRQGFHCVKPATMSSQLHLLEQRMITREVAYMTNRKIKNYHINKLAYDIVYDNLKMLCIVLLCLNKHYPRQFYRLNVRKWLDEHEEWCDMMNEYEEDDIYDYKMNEFCMKCGIDDDTAMKIVEKHLNKYNDTNMKILRENLKLALVHTGYDFSFGKVRLKRIADALLEEEYLHWKDDILKFGISIEKDLEDFNFEKFKNKKKHEPTIQECKDAAQKLEMYRAYFESVINSEE